MSRSLCDRLSIRELALPANALGAFLPIDWRLLLLANCGRTLGHRTVDQEGLVAKYRSAVGLKIVVARPVVQRARRRKSPCAKPSAGTLHVPAAIAPAMSGDGVAHDKVRERHR